MAFTYTYKGKTYGSDSSASSPATEEKKNNEEKKTGGFSYTYKGKAYTSEPASIFNDANPFLGKLNPTDDIGEQKISRAVAPQKTTSPLPQHFLAPTPWTDQRNNVVDALVNATPAVVQRERSKYANALAAAEGQYDRSQRAIAEAQRKIPEIDRQISSTSERVGLTSDPAELQRLDNQLADLRRQREDLQSAIPQSQETIRKLTTTQEEQDAFDRHEAEQKAQRQEYANLLSQIRELEVGLGMATTPETEQNVRAQLEPLYAEQRRMESEYGIKNPDVASSRALQGAVYQGSDTVVSGFTNFLDSVLGEPLQEVWNIMGLDKYDNPITALNKYVNRTAQQNQEYFSEQVAGDAEAERILKYGSTTVAALPAVVLAFMTAGTSELTTAGLESMAYLNSLSGAEQTLATIGSSVAQMTTDPSFVTSFVQEAGNAYKSALNEGMDTADAAVYSYLYGYLSAIVEVGGTSELAGGLQQYAKEVKAGGKGIEEVLKGYAKNIVGEMGEEVTQGILERGTKSFFGQDTAVYSNDPNRNSIINPAQMGEEAKGAAVVSAILGGSGLVQDVNSSVNAETNQQKITPAAVNSPTEVTPQATTPSANPQEITSGTVNPNVDALVDVLQNSRNAETGLVTRKGIDTILGNEDLINLFNANSDTPITNQNNAANRAVIRENADAVVDALLGTQQNIDNATTPAYNGDININVGEEANGTESGLGGETDTGIPAVQRANDTGTGSEGLNGRTDTGRAESRLTEERNAVQALSQSKGIVNVGLQDSTDSAFYSSSLQAAKDADPAHGNYVSFKDADEIQHIIDEGGVVKIVPDGSAGVIVKADGDIVAVFKNQQTGKPGSLPEMLVTALANGGTKLDCYGVGLVNKYAQAGFVPVSRCVFNPEIAMEYDGWTQQQIDEYKAKWGHDPDVIFMMYNGDSASTVANNYGNYTDGYSWADLDALPTYDGDTSYDDAQAYRDAQLAERGKSTSEDVKNVPLAQKITEPDVNNEITLKERGESRNIRTDESMAQQLREFKDKNPDIYQVVKNSSLIKKALKTYNEMGVEGSAATLERALADAQNGKKLPLEMVPLHKLVCDELSRIGQVERANRISADLGAELTYAGQLSQANAIFRNSSPTARADAFEKTVNRLIAENNANVDADAVKDLITRFREAGNDTAARDAVIDDAMTAIAQSSPTTFTEALNAIRYLNMLGNFKTQLRNIFGNTGMWAAARLKNRALAIEQYAANAFLDAIESDRSIEQTNTLTTNRNLYREAWELFKQDEAGTMAEGKYSDYLAKNKAIADKKTIFKWNWKGEAETSLGKAGRAAANAPMWVLEKYRKATNWAMEKGDVIFQRLTYAQVLADYAKAQGYRSLSDIEPETLQRMRDHAIKEAAEATFHDSNVVSDKIAGFDKNWSKVGKGLGQAIMPFRKTPANVGVRMEEYSPLGLINTFVNAARAAKGTANANDVLNSAAKSLTGTALAALGFILAKNGIARGKEDDKEIENYERNVEGLSDYSIVLEDGTTVSLDWFQPASAAFFMGVAAHDLFDDGVQSQDFLSLLGTTSDIALNMSFLSGLQSSAKGLSSFNGNMDALPLFLLNSFLSYAGQIGTNSLVSQGVQSSQEYRQSYYSNNEDSIVPTDMQYNVAKLLAKIPGTDYNRADFIDAWGRKQDNGGLGGRIAENFLSPAYINEGRTSEVDDELKNVYEKTGVSVFPKIASRSLKVDEQKLTPEEYDIYQTTAGSKSLEFVTDLIKTDEYKNASADEKAEMIKDMYSFANQLANAAIRESRGQEATVSNDYKKYVGLEDPVEAIIWDNKWAGATHKGEYDNRAIDAMIADLPNINEDTAEAFRTHDYVEKLEAAAALADPILAKDFFNIHDTGVELKKKDELLKETGEDTRDYTATDAFIDSITPLYTDDDGNLKKEVVDIFTSYYGNNDELVEAKLHDMDSKTWYMFKDAYDQIDALKVDENGDPASPTFKHNKFADFVERADVPEAQKAFIKDQLQFWTSRPVENTAYDKMTTNDKYTVNPDNAFRWVTEISDLPILDGNKAVTGTQKAKVFWDDESVPVTERIEGMIAGNVQPKMHDFAVWLNGQYSQGNLTMAQINAYWSECQRLTWWKRSFDYALKHSK